MPLCILLIALAAGSAAVVAYGTQPTWAQFSHGVEFIVLTRRLQGPLIVFCILLCLILIGLVVAEKRRALWLIALGPILALFAHRFVTGPSRLMSIVENPNLVPAAEASFMQEDDYVVGVQFADEAYAYPFAALYVNPVVVQSDREQRMMVMWSAPANSARAVNIARELKARDLEIVGLPANALLIYDSRLGQFINGLTAHTIAGQPPVGIKDPIASTKTTWANWRNRHPDTMVMVPPLRTDIKLPRRPVLPFYPMPKLKDVAKIDAPICVINSSPPVAMAGETISNQPMNLPGDVPMLVFRDRSSGNVRAFDRRLKDELVPKFSPAKIDSKHPGAIFTDGDSHSLWTADGVAIFGPLKGQKLRALEVDDDVYLGVMKFWFPNLNVIAKPAS